MVRERRQVKFKVGTRVTNTDGRKGVVVRLGGDELVVYVKWDDMNWPELTEVSTLKKRR